MVNRIAKTLRVFLALALSTGVIGASLLSSTELRAQSLPRNLRTQRVVLDDSLGHFLTLQSSSLASNAALTFPAPQYGLFLSNNNGVFSVLTPGLSGNILVSNGSAWQSVAQSSITSLGTITSGTWNGTQIGTTYGGTGLDGHLASNGSLLIGNGAGYSLSTLTQGSGITITNGAGTISIANAGVTAFNGRTGSVTPTTGDYTAAQVTNAADLTAANTFVDQTQTMRRNNIKTTYTDGLILGNLTSSDATNTVQQSPNLTFKSHVWNTTATAADNSFDGRITFIPASGASPTAKFSWATSKNGAAYAEKMSLSDGGVLTVSNGLSISAGTAAFGSASVTGSNFAISGGSIDGTTIGSTTKSTGGFTALTSTGAATLGTGASLTNSFGTGTSATNTIGATGGTTTINGTTNFGGSVAHGANQVTGSNFAITGGSIDGTTIGSTTKSTGGFTALSSTGAATLGTGASLTNTFGTGTSATNTIGATGGTTTINGTTNFGGTVAHGANQVTGSNFAITGGSIDGTTIGSTTKSTGGFTMVTATGSIASNTGLQAGVGNSSTGSLTLYNSSNANSVVIQSGATSPSYTMTLPTAQGAANTVLSNNGSGTLSWVPVGSTIELTNTADSTITSSTESNVGLRDMDAAPGAGTYLVLFSATVELSTSGNGKGTSISFYKNGTQIASTVRNVESPLANITQQVQTQAVVTLADNEHLTMKWHTLTNGNTSTVHARSLILVRLF